MLKKKTKESRVNKKKKNWRWDEIWDFRSCIFLSFVIYSNPMTDELYTPPENI